MPRSAAVRTLSVVGRISRRRVESIESGTTTQRTPAGTDPTGTPVAASLTNSSPLSDPPIDAFGPPAAIAIRNSGSPGEAPSGRGTVPGQPRAAQSVTLAPDRKSTRLNSSHVAISYAVFCLKKKNITNEVTHSSKV